MTYLEILENARKNLDGRCRACFNCNGRACAGIMPGPGGKMTGDGFIRNYNKIHDIKINMDTMYEDIPIETNFSMLGQSFKYPFFAAPIAAIAFHYGDYLDDDTYAAPLVHGCKNAGIAAFVGDGFGDSFLSPYLREIKLADGLGIPTIKPWNTKEIMRKIELCVKSGAPAIAMDIDAAGLPHLKKDPKYRVSPRTSEELAEIIKNCPLPFIVKGVMTPKVAYNVAKAGAYGIVISNHGGRVLDDTPSTIEVLSDIRATVGKGIKIFIDGGIRTGIDVFKAIALGADAALIGRPFPTMAYGGGREAIEFYINKVGNELRDTMMMTGAHNLSEINREMIFGRSLDFK